MNENSCANHAWGLFRVLTTNCWCSCAEVVNCPICLSFVVEVTRGSLKTNRYDHQFKIPSTRWLDQKLI